MAKIERSGVTRMFLVPGFPDVDLAELQASADDHVRRHLVEDHARAAVEVAALDTGALTSLHRRDHGR